MDSADSSCKKEQVDFAIWLEERSIQQIPALQKKGGSVTFKKKRKKDGQAGSSVFKNMISPAGS